MDFSELAKTVAKLGAPILGGALLGPAGAAAGAALAAKFGADSIEPAVIAQKIESDPKAIDKLLELEKLKFADRADARGLKAKLAQFGVIEKRPTVIAYTLMSLLGLLLLNYFICVYFKIEIAEPLLIQLSAIGGFLTGKISSVVDFDYGDSAEKIKT